ncbi:MAG: selenocysteine-specific translation elongation factor [Deltaproteobacteria bacterium RIFCSPLOWO2_01_FULL_38_9]|nr:MAG: selenocysteine-specific translation elongation factor [Deltaproteobacteria bacterium RIFCSPLOWO2_01_FULL_38_9]
MKSFIIGTAGHVDHGKTALVKALTCIDTDRLKEEKKRGISIELGYAPLKLSEDITAGIVDVPGHERLIKTMVMGATQTDLVLFIVAANEGMKPQSLEHLSIFSLLGVKNAILVITKIDCVEKLELPFIIQNIQIVTKGTFLENAPVVLTSSYTKEGVEELKQKISEFSKQFLETQSSHRATLPLRIPIDRVFTLTGFGTIVTGPLLFGQISKNDEIEIYPHNLKATVRQIHAYGKEYDILKAPSRVALNLRGVSKEDLKKGQVIGSPHTFKAISKASAKVTFLKPIQGQEFIFHTGTMRTNVILKKKNILQFSDPLVLQPGDKFILRRDTTLGGGEIVNVSVNTHKSIKRGGEEVFWSGSKAQPLQGRAMKRKTTSSPPLLGDNGQALRILEYFKKTDTSSSWIPIHTDDVCKNIQMPRLEISKALLDLIKQAKIIRLPQGYYLSCKQGDELKEKIKTFFKTKGELSVVDIKEIFSISRKYAIPYLEFFDEQKWTIRRGDVRIPWKILE